LITDPLVRPVPGNAVTASDAEAADVFHREPQITPPHLQEWCVVQAGWQLGPAFGVFRSDCNRSHVSRSGLNKPLRQFGDIQHWGMPDQAESLSVVASGQWHRTMAKTP
jgi:hypothetical protein